MHHHLFVSMIDTFFLQRDQSIEVLWVNYRSWMFHRYQSKNQMVGFQDASMCTQKQLRSEINDILSVCQFKSTCRTRFELPPPKIIASPLNIVEQDPSTYECPSKTAFSSINLPSALNTNEFFCWIKSKWSCSVLNSQKSPVKPSKQEHSKILSSFSNIWFEC